MFRARGEAHMRADNAHDRRGEKGSSNRQFMVHTFLTHVLDHKFKYMYVYAVHLYIQYMRTKHRRSVLLMQQHNAPKAAKVVSRL